MRSPSGKESSALSLIARGEIVEEWRLVLRSSISIVEAEMKRRRIGSGAGTFVRFFSLCRHHRLHNLFMSNTATSPRLVPGAPPPIALSKSQRKKKKTKAKSGDEDPEQQVVILDPTSAALTEKAPEPSDIQEGVVAPQLVAQPSEDTTELAEPKLSPIVDLITKRLKATNKKIVRAFTVFFREPN